MNNNQLTTLQVDWNLLFGSMTLFVFIVGMMRVIGRILVPEHPTNTLVTTTKIEPAYYVAPGIYDWNYLAMVADVSARNAEMYAHVVHLSPLYRFKWEYRQVPLWKIDKDDRRYSTMAKYLYRSPEEIDEDVALGRLSLDDYAILSTDGEYYQETPNDFSIAFGLWLKNNIARCRRIHTEIMNSKKYYPPVLDRDYSPLNGAHRVAVLWREYGADYKVWAWVMQAPVTSMKAEQRPILTVRDRVFESCRPGFQGEQALQIGPRGANEELRLAHRINRQLDRDFLLQIEA